MGDAEQKKMKTILFILDAPFSDWKGTQRFIYSLGKYLMAHSFNVIVLENRSKKMQEKSVPIDIEIPFDVKTIHFRKFFGLGAVSKKTIESLKPDFVYVAFLNLNPFIPSFRYQTIFGSHILHLSHLSYASLKKRITFSMKRSVLRLISYICWRDKPIAFHTLTIQQKQWINSVTGSKHSIFTIENPIESCDCVKSSFHLSKNNRFRILFLGSFSQDKGFDTFLRIIDILNASEQGKRIEIIAAGSGVMKPLLEKYINMYGNIIFYERPTDKKKYELFHESDLMVYPSLMDIYPYTIAEAQISGMPVLAGDTSRASCIIMEGQTGYTIPLRSIDSFVDRIRQYYNMWNADFGGYCLLRNNIATYSKRLCENYILPKYLEMFKNLSSQKEANSRT